MKYYRLAFILLLLAVASGIFLGLSCGPKPQPQETVTVTVTVKEPPEPTPKPTEIPKPTATKTTITPSPKITMTTTPKPSIKPTEKPSVKPSIKPTATPKPTVTEKPTPTTTQTITPTATPTTTIKTRGRVAIIIDDLGNNSSDPKAFYALNVPITLSILPKLAHSSAIAQETRRRGLGVMLHLPMEAMGGNRLGPGGILVGMSDTELKSTIVSDLASVPGARGVNNHMGSRACLDERVAKTLMTVLRERGLFFVDSMTPPSGRTSKLYSTARQIGIRAGSRHVFLDNNDNKEYIKGQLRQLAAVALRNGTAIGIGHPRSNTPTAIQEMIPEFKKMGIELVLAEQII